VIIGFINADPATAVVLGMYIVVPSRLLSALKIVNHEKGFTTRSKMHVKFNDDKKTITIDTPAGNSMHSR